jgi:8-oxo-dGTP diphosphatase
MRTLFRVGAILFQDGKLVTTKMKKGNSEYHVVPGGGVEYNENLYEALKREIEEELNVQIINFRLVYIRELNIKDYGRGAEFYFYIERYEGVPKKGYDPENKESSLEEVCFLDIDEIKNNVFLPAQLSEALIEDAKNNFPIFRHLGLHTYP